MMAKKSAGGFVFRPSSNYIRLSAEIIRAAVKRHTPLRCMDLEASTPAGSILRLVQFSDRPSYMCADDVRDGAEKFRRVGYGYYAECFYHNGASFAIDHQGGIDQVQAQMMGICKNELASLRPKFVEVRDSIMCDIFPSASMEK